MTTVPKPFANQLLRAMSDEDRTALSDRLELIACPRGMVLVEAEEQMPCLYFVESGVASIIARSPEGLRSEAGVVGREGLVPASLLLGGERAPHRVEMQIAGAAYRIGREPFRDAFRASASLRELMLRYAHVLGMQIAFTSLSNSVHQVDERLARWLLMCHDRCDSDDIALTHDYLSIMLAVRRPSVTNALHVLEGSGFIAAERGSITVRRRAALEEFAADAYGRPEAEYRALIGSF